MSTSAAYTAYIAYTVYTAYSFYRSDPTKAMKNIREFMVKPL